MTDVVYNFNFPFHMVADEYPNNSAVVAFGRGYTFAAQPDGPPQITFHLSFQTMWRWFDAVGDLDKTVEGETNLEKLIYFYEFHQLYLPFYYLHPTRGQTLCRFQKPLQVPKPLGNNMVSMLSNGYTGHAVEPFNVDLIMQPH